MRRVRKHLGEGPTPNGAGGQATRLVRTTSSDPPPEDVTERRWRRRPVWAALVRIVIVVTPLAASVAAGVAASRAFRPTGVAALIGWLAWTALVSIVVLALVDVTVRRLLPLQRLLQLCLVFPDRAPSRLRLAVQAARPRRPEAMAARDTAPATAAATAAHIVRLLGALSVHDRRTRGHSERVCAYTELLAEQMHLDQPQRDRLMWVALVHDMGKLDVPRRLLNKPGRPTVSEWHVLQEHPARGAEMIAPLRGWLGDWADAVEQHHERYDGAGYPRGLRGEEISLGGRILAVTDAYEVMTAPRAYRRPVDAQTARAELARHAGTQFDPEVVRQFLAVGLPELSRAMGLLAWLGQLPFIRQWPRLQSQTSAATTQALTSTAMATSAAVVAVGAGAAVGTGAVVPAVADPPPAQQQSAHVTGADAATQSSVRGDGRTDKAATADRRAGAARSGAQAEAGATPQRHHQHAARASSSRPADTDHSHAVAPGDVPPAATTDHGRHLGWQRGPERRSDRANLRAQGPRHAH